MIILHISSYDVIYLAVFLCNFIKITFILPVVLCSSDRTNWTSTSIELWPEGSFLCKICIVSVGYKGTIFEYEKGDMEDIV